MTENEKQHSIKVTKTTKGYTWEIKRYYGDDEPDEKVLSMLASLNSNLQALYG